MRQAMPMSCDTMPVVWTRMRSSSRSRPGLRPATTSPMSACRRPRSNCPASIMSRNSRTVMLESQSSITTLSNRVQPAGSISRRASETKVAPGRTQASRLTISVRVVPPMAISALRTTSSTPASGRTGMPRSVDHLAAKASRVSGRRDVQMISSNRYTRRREYLIERIEVTQAAQAVLAHGADADEPQCSRCLGPQPFERDHRGRRTADGVGPMLVQYGHRLPGPGLRQHDVAGAVETVDGVAHAVVEIRVQPHAPDRLRLPRDGIDVAAV